MSLEICSHCRQLVGCQMPNFFSRITGRSPRVSADSRKLVTIVSATVSTAGLAMLVLSLSRPHGKPAWAGLFRSRPELSLKSRLERDDLSSSCSILLSEHDLFGKSAPAPYQVRAGFFLIMLQKPRSSPPGLLLFPAPLAAGALLLGAEIEFLDVL